MEALTTLDRDRIATLLERDEYFWLDVEAPSPEDVRQLGDAFGFHPLSLEDTAEFGQRPKVEDYGDYVFVVFYGVAPPVTGGDARPDGGEPELVEVHIYVSGSWVVTVHPSRCAELLRLRETLHQHGAQSEQLVVYRVFDALTDSFFPVLDRIGDEIDELEEALSEDPSPQNRQQLTTLRRKLVLLRRRVAPQRDMFARQMDQIMALPGLEPDTRDYFRDVYDHLLRVGEEIDSYRELLSLAMDIYLSTVSNRTNAVMKQLTVIATIFLPLTFITGFFGQNFGWLVRSISTQADFLLFGIGGVVIPILILLGMFRVRGWL